jgi:hypothetical protein
MSLNRNQKIISESYLRFIRSKPCVISGVYGVVAAHVRARGTEEHKRNDYLTLPLTWRKHDEQGKLGWEKFEEKYKFNRFEEVTYLLIEYFQGQESQMQRSGESTSQIF